MQADRVIPTQFDPTCELCEAAQFTHWYSADEICWVADCEVCVVPMVVWRKHGTEPDAADLAHMHAALGAAGDARFGEGNWQPDANMRQIPTHFHAHARDRDWFAQRTTRPMSRFTGVGNERVER